MSLVASLVKLASKNGDCFTKIRNNFAVKTSVSSLSYISECQQANSSCDACVKVGKVQVSCLTLMVI